jgi:hypothetical protein
MTLSRCKPMTRTAIRSSRPTGVLAQASFAKVRKPMKVSRPKMTPIRKAARGQECTLRFDCCNGRTDTTVLCHSNQLADGKGMGIKAPDLIAVFGCHSCHDVLDGRAPRPDGMTYEAMLERFGLALERTHIILHEKGLL